MIVFTGWPRPRLTWYHENTVLDSSYQLLVDDNRNGAYHKKKYDHATVANVTENRLVLTNLTRWHPIMNQRQRTVGVARLTCQASNNIVTATSGGFSRPSVSAANGVFPPPATTEHTFIRLNREYIDCENYNNVIFFFFSSKKSLRKFAKLSFV